MCAYYMSPIYQDVTARLLAKSGSVCLSLSIGKDDAASVHITLNPMQAKLLGKYLRQWQDRFPWGKWEQTVISSAI